MTIPSYATTEERDAIRAAQGAKVVEFISGWQAKWHALFDADPMGGPNDEFASAGPIPDDVYADSRLISGISRMSDETRNACFALLPKGGEMAARFATCMAQRPEMISRDAAAELGKDIARALADCDLNEDVDLNELEVFDQLDEPARAALRNSDNIPVLFERSLLEPHPTDKLPEFAARLFLSEPLYASFGNWFEPCDWIKGPLGDPFEDKCHALNYQLWQGGWRMMLGEGGFILMPLR